MWIGINDKLFNMSKVESICKYDDDAIVFHYEDKEKKTTILALSISTAEMTSTEESRKL